MALKPFKPGQSGNPGGRRLKPMVDRMLEQALVKNDSETAKVIADKLISMAKHGSLSAIKLIAERTEGRPQKNAADTQQKPEVQLTKEQIQARLTELLSSPEVKEQFAKLLFSQDKVQ
jgi:HPt (histidine-containing phosphotransfer) domain-containing protein